VSLTEINGHIFKKGMSHSSSELINNNNNNNNNNNIVKVKLSLCLTKHHDVKTYWGVEV
jgi:hypothetical protein